MSKTSIELGTFLNRGSALHDVSPLFSVEVTPTTSSVVVTSSVQANQGIGLGVVRVANGTSGILVSVGEAPNAAAHPRRYVAPGDCFEGIIKPGHSVAVMLAPSDY